MRCRVLMFKKLGHGTAPIETPNKKKQDRDQEVTRQIKYANSSVDSEAQLIETLLIPDVVFNKDIDTVHPWNGVISQLKVFVFCDFYWSFQAFHSPIRYSNPRAKISTYYN